MTVPTKIPVERDSEEVLDCVTVVLNVVTVTVDGVGPGTSISGPFSEKDDLRPGGDVGGPFSEKGDL